MNTTIQLHHRHLKKLYLGSRGPAGAPSGYRTGLLTALVASLALGSVFFASATVYKVDSTETWEGYINLTQTNGFNGGFVSGSYWPTADLRAQFIPTNSPTGWPLNTAGVMKPNTSTFDTNNPFWNDPDGNANKFIEANWFVSLNDAGGTSVTFEGTVISNTIPLTDSPGIPNAEPAYWIIQAWVKELTPGPVYVGRTASSNLTTGPFTVTRSIAPGNLAQYGFSVYGPNTAPGSPDSLTGLGVMVEDADLSIIGQPVGQTVTGGSDMELMVEAIGSTPPSYQWTKDGSMLVDGGGISGATSNRLTLANIQTGDAGAYSVTVSNLSGVVTSEVAVVAVVFPPEITVNPFSQDQPAGSAITLMVLNDGTPPFSYQWSKDASSIPDETNSTFVINPAQTNDAGDYSVVVSNPYGAATSQVASVFIYIPVSIALPPVSQVAPAFSTIQFSVASDGYPDPGHQWFFDGSAIPDGTLPTLTVSNVDLPDLGQYSVLVSNAYSSELSSPATLSMSPSIVSPFVGATAIWGLDALLSVGAIGSDVLSYQWYKDGAVIGGGTNETLLLPNVQFTNGGLYSVVVSSTYGVTTNTPALLVVNPAGTSLGLYAGITLTGAVGNSLTIEYTSDLTDTNSWLVATNLTLEHEVQLWVDESVEARSLPKRFYRVLPGP